MIRSYTRHIDPAFHTYLEELERIGFGESTSNGFDYIVADPEAIGMKSGLVGMITETPSEIQVELVLGEDIPKEARDKMAQICFASADAHDRYAVARAADQVVRGAEPELLPSLVRHMHQNLRAHLYGIHRLDSMGLREQTHPLSRDMLKSTLGWLALNREPHPNSHEQIEKLKELSLFIPSFEDNIRLSATLTTKRGNIPVGLATFTEKSEKHLCPCCEGQIIRGSTRITLSEDKPRGNYDHHHYHPVCFIEKILPKIDMKSARIEDSSNMPWFTQKKR